MGIKMRLVVLSVLLLKSQMAWSDSWVVLGTPVPTQAIEQLAFIPQSIQKERRTVVIARTNHDMVLTAEMNQLQPTAGTVKKVIAERHYLCAKQQYHTPAAQYLGDKDRVLYEYDYRYHTGLRFRTAQVDMNNVAESTLFKKVCWTT